MHYKYILGYGQKSHILEFEIKEKFLFCWYTNKTTYIKIKDRCIHHVLQHNIFTSEQIF